MPHLFDIAYIVATYGYLGIFIIVFLESGIFFALPGDSLLFTVGLMASSGSLNIFILVPIIFIGTFLGGLIGYWIGVNLEKLRKYSFFRKIFKDEHERKAHEFFEKYGSSAVVFSRFVPIVRTFTPIVAGVAKMNFQSFTRYSIVGSILWSFVVTLSGYFLGNTFPWIKDFMPIVILLVVILSILPAVFEVWKNKRHSGQ